MCNQLVEFSIVNNQSKLHRCRVRFRHKQRRRCPVGDDRFYETVSEKFVHELVSCCSLVRWELVGMFANWFNPCEVHVELYPMHSPHLPIQQHPIMINAFLNPIHQVSESSWNIAYLHLRVSLLEVLRVSWGVVFRALLQVGPIILWVLFLQRRVRILTRVKCLSNIRHETQPIRCSVALSRHVGHGDVTMNLTVTFSHLPPLLPCLFLFCFLLHSVTMPLRF